MLAIGKQYLAPSKSVRPLKKIDLCLAAMLQAAKSTSLKVDSFKNV